MCHVIVLLFPLGKGGSRANGKEITGDLRGVFEKPMGKVCATFLLMLCFSEVVREGVQRAVLR